MQLYVVSCTNKMTSITTNTISVNSLIVFILTWSVKDVFGNDCTEKAAEYKWTALTMCEASSVSGERVIIDTYDSSSKGVDSCSCTAKVTSAKLPFTQLNMSPLADLQPGRNSGCGSRIELVKGEVTSVSECDLTAAYMDVQTGDAVSIKWKMNADSTNSKYCVHMYFNKGQSTMSVNCTASGSTVQPQSTSAVQTSVAPTTSITDTTTRSQITTVTTHTTRQQEATVTSTNNQENTSQTPKSNTSTGTDDGSLPLEIVAPAAGGAVVVLIVVVVVAVICSRKSKTRTGLPNHEEKQGRGSHGYDNSLNPYASVNRGMDQGDDDGMKPNALYVSADETLVTNGINSHPSDMYAEVQKKPKSILKDDSRNSKPEATETPDNSPGDVYAVVNKTRSQGGGQESEPSRYLNDEGLVYSQVDVSGGDAPLPPPKQFRDDSPADDRVVYSEVTTEL